ncbi:YlbF family regulator [Aerococcus vaginalis]
MANIYDTINDLERQVRELDEYAALKAAMEDVKADEEASNIYNKFRELQQGLQLKLQMGQEPSEEEMTEAQNLQKEMSDNALIAALMEKEQQLNRVLNDVNNAVTKPIQEIYA